MAAADTMRSGWAGLFLGPIAWILNTGIGYALVPWTCGHHSTLLIPGLGAAFALLSLVGAAVSWLTPVRTPEDHEGNRLAPFGRNLGITTGLLFAVVIALQGAAGTIVHGCVR